MPKKVPADISTDPDPTHRILVGLVAHLGAHEVPKFLKPYIERGDIDVLRLVLESGVVGADKLDIPLLSCIVPLVEHAAEPDKDKARALVDEWRSAFGPFNQEKLDIQLSTATEHSARNLLALGANPNGFGSVNRNLTALGRTHGTRHFDAALLMLKTLAARNELPIQAYNVVPDSTVSRSNTRFAIITESEPQDISYFYGLLSRIGGKPDGVTLKIEELKKLSQDIFKTIDVPDSWRRDLAKSFVKTATAKGIRKDGQRAEIFGELLVQAEFGSAVNFRNVVSFFAADLCRENCVDVVANLANRLVEMGWHPDQIKVPSPGALERPQELTWLQAAAFHDKPEMVMALLEAGADPNMRSYDDTGANAYDLAEKHPQTLAVLTTWKAKSAIDSIIRNSRLSAAAGNDPVSRQP